MNNIEIEGKCKYELKSKIGSGGFGNVWLANDKYLNKDVALKILPVGENINETMLEAQIGNKLSHHNLAKIHYANTINLNNMNCLIISMDYFEHGSICNLLNSENFLPLKEAVKYICDIARGLEYLHTINIFHNDIKPSNILIGEMQQGVLTDYGISHIVEGEYGSSTRFYSPHLAPEIIGSNIINTQTEVYQLGLTFYRLACGIHNLKNNYMALDFEEYINLMRRKKIIKNYPFIPKNIRRIINKVTNPEPSKRYKTIQEFRNTLERVSIMASWDCSSDGLYFATSTNNTYTYNFSSIGNNLFRFDAFKTNNKSNKKTKVHNYSENNLHELALNKLQEKFMQDVVVGILK